MATVHRFQRPDECKSLGCKLSIDELGMSHVVTHVHPNGESDAWSWDTASQSMFNLSDAQTELNFWTQNIHQREAAKATQGVFYECFAQCRILGCQLDFKTEPQYPAHTLRHNGAELTIDAATMALSTRENLRYIIKDFLSTQHAQSTTGAKPMDSTIYDLYGKPIRDFDDALDIVLGPKIWKPESIAAAKLVLKYHSTLGRKVFMELAADGGCPQCTTASSLSIDPPSGNYGRTASHDSMTTHLGCVMQVKPEEVVPLLEYVLGDDGAFLEPESRPQTFYGWRGYVPNEHFPILQGAWKQVWGTAHMAAECPHWDILDSRLRGIENARDLCIEHIKTRGQTAIGVKETPIHQIVFSEATGKDCACGIYGYAKYDGLIRQQADANYIFTFMAYGAAWGYVAMDEDENFKATDFRIDHMYLVKTRMAAYMGLAPVSSSLKDEFKQFDLGFDWKALAAAYAERYGVKVYLVEREADVRMWEDLQSLTNSVGVNDDD